jgi:glycosyltransferase involved in cell wall biosynthesis
VSRSLVYIALYDPQTDIGVHKKIVGTVDAARAEGYAARVWSEPFRGVRPLVRAAVAIARAPEQYVLVRSVGSMSLFIVPALCIARLRGHAVVVDVPTPHAIGVSEVWSSSQSLWRRLRAVTLYYLSGPWAFWPATRIVQYAEEGAWFAIGNGARTIKIGNAIDVAAMRQRRTAPAWPAPTLRLISVSTIVNWQGYDRLFQAMAAFLRDPRRAYDVHATLVGDGPAVEELRRLAASLGIAARVEFAGPLTGDALLERYEQAHLAVGALALHRKGLRESSNLKVREYTAVAIPFIAAGADADFVDAPFRIAVSHDDRIESIVEAFHRFGAVRAAVSDANIRRYAVERLDFQRKFPGLLP